MKFRKVGLMRRAMGGLLVILLVLLAAVATEADEPYRRAVIDNSARYLHVREAAPNRSPEIDRMHRTMGLPYGNPWCMMFVYQVHEDVETEHDIPNPLPKSPRVSVVWKAAQKNPYRYQVIKAKRLALGIEKGLPADAVIWSSGKVAGNDNWNGHTGLLLAQPGGTALRTREGNTTPGEGGDQRDGGGVYDRTRNLNIGKRFQVEGLIRIRNVESGIRNGHR